MGSLRDVLRMAFEKEFAAEWALYGQVRPGRVVEAQIAALRFHFAKPGAVTDEMVKAYHETHVAHWDKHWVDSQDGNFAKTRLGADRAALSAALQKME